LLRAAVLFLFFVPLAAASAAPQERRVVVEERPGSIVVANEAGTWTVRTRCASGRRLTVGPGYVSRLVAADGTVIVDDWRRRGVLNDPEFGGLGAFGWHHARGRPGRLRFRWNNAWEMSGRICARANGRFGVVGAEVVEQPREEGDAVEFRIDVLFTDAYTFPAPILRAAYSYRFEPALVRSRVDLYPLCPRGRCGRTSALAFVKEPKLVAHLTGGAFSRMATFVEDGTLACIYVGGGPPSGPILDTGQCAAQTRARLRFDYGTGTSGSEGGCDVAACLDVAVEQSGLDAWARRAAQQPPAFHRDTPSVDGVVWHCNGPSPAASGVRRWETTGRLTASGRYLSLGGIFPAWEGGRGGYDCEPLARPFPPGRPRYSVQLTYSLGRTIGA
jgi:hypothetical protein